MRIKKRCVLVTFKSTNEAIEFEANCTATSGRLIPLPGQIHAGCGLAWKSPVENKSALLQMIYEKKLKIDEIYELEL